MVSHKYLFSSNKNNICLVPHMSIPRFSIANRLSEQAAEYKRRNGPLARDPRRASCTI